MPLATAACLCRLLPLAIACISNARMDHRCLGLAPEHPLVAAITTEEHRAEVEAYQTQCSRKSDMERAEGKTKTGVFTARQA